MRKPIDYGSHWKSLRYKWKRDVAACRDLTQGAKYLATQICDNYANSKTACCWPKTSTLARSIGVDIRTIQRYLVELRTQGWVTEVDIAGHAGAFQLTSALPRRLPTAGDKLVGSRAANLSPEHDNSVASYRKPKKEPLRRAFASVVVRGSEEEVLREWSDWIERHTDYDVASLFSRISSSDSFTGWLEWREWSPV